MDYSAINPDPAGDSPWGSPRVDQSTFPTFNNNDVPEQSPLGGESDDHHDTYKYPENAGGDGSPNTEEVSEGLHNASLGEAEYPTEQESQQPYATEQTQDAQNQRTQLPARYHPGARQYVKQPPAPVHRIQAKITGLERVGKKDPILRFDIHVSIIFLNLPLLVIE